MAEKLYRQEWEDAIHDAAIAAAAEWRKYVSDNGVDATEDGERNAYEKISAKLMKEYPYESVTNEDMIKLSNIPGERLWKWSIAGGADPRVKQREENLEKFMPLITGAAKNGDDWQSMDADALMLKAAEQYGYDYTREGFAEFLKKMAEAQQQYDLAQIDKELREQRLGIPGTGVEFGPNGSAYILGSLTSPSATKAIDDAVATGNELTAGKAAGLAALDAGTNTAIFAAPSASLLKSKPILNGFLDAGMQAGAEGVRQFSAPAIYGNIEADPASIAAAGTLGATRPGLVGTAQMALAKVPTKQAYQISRGIGKATRSGNPAMQARDDLAAQVLNYNKMLLNGELKAGERVVDMAGEKKLLGAFAFKKQAQELGVKPNANGTYSAEAILKAYDKKPVRLVSVTEEGVVPVAGEAEVGAGEVLLTPERFGNYSAMFPQRIADEAEKTAATKAGLVIGRWLGDIGGRVEPVIKVNPLSMGPHAVRDYKDTEWYARLTPEQKKLYDEAMKAKAAQQ